MKTMKKFMHILCGTCFALVLLLVMFCTGLGTSTSANAGSSASRMNTDIITKKSNLVLQEIYAEGLRSDNGIWVQYGYDLKTYDEYDYIEVSVSGSPTVELSNASNSVFQYDTQDRYFAVDFRATANAINLANTSILNTNDGNVTIAMLVYANNALVQKNEYHISVHITPFGSFTTPYDMKSARWFYNEWLYNEGITTSDEYTQRDNELSRATAEGTGMMIMPRSSNLYANPTDVVTRYTATISGNTVSFSGRVTFTDTNGVERPARQIHVQIMRQNGLIGSTIANLQTNANGEFSASGIDRSFNIYFRISASTLDGFDVNPSMGSTYSFTNTPRVFTGTTSGFVRETGTDCADAFYVHQAIIVGRAYSSAMGYSNTPNVTFPRSATQYNPATDTIWIENEYYSNFDVILHEYGHYIMDKLNFEDQPSDDHRWTDILTDTQQHKDKGIKFAWGEGWASYFAIASQLHQNVSALNIPFAGDTDFDYVDVSTGSRFSWVSIGTNTSHNGRGEGNEMAVARILHNLVSTAILTHQQLWNICNNSKPMHLSAFMEHVYANTPNSQINDIATILRDQNVVPSLTTAAGSEIIYDNPHFSWSINAGNPTGNRFVSQTYFDEFTLVFYDLSFNKINFEVAALKDNPYVLKNNHSHTLTNSQLNSFKSLVPQQFYWGIKVNQYASSVNTGPYLSELRLMSKPTFNMTLINGGKEYSVNGLLNTSLTNLNIPATYNGRPVTRIGNSAFANQTALTQISIPSSVTKIGYEAFSPQTVLTSYGGNRANIDLVVADGTKDTYIANGWTGFNIVELSASGPLTVTSGQLRGIIEIPTTFNNRVITEIGENGFINQSEITGIILPISVSSIGSSAFSNCSNLESIFYCSGTGLTNTPDHSTSYSNYYYTERSLDVNLIAGYTYTLSFDYDNLTASTDISNVFTSLGVGENTFQVDLPVQKAFTSTYGTQVIVFTPTKAQLALSSKLWCRFIRTGTPQTVSIDISNIEIDVGVTNIDIDAFTGCEKLATPGLSFSLLSDNTYAVTGMANNIGEVILYITRTLFVPSVYDGIEVTQIAPSAFKDYDMIKWAFIQSGISFIGDRAFQFCDNLEVVDMSATAVTSIEAYTFDTCNLLENINLPNNLLAIGEGAFIRTKVVPIIPDSVLTIGSYAFAYGERFSFELPYSLVSIGSYAFAYSNCMLALTYSGYSLTTIGEHAFDSTSMPAMTQIYPSITTIGAYAYYNSSFFSTFALPASSQLNTIGNYAFGNNNLTRIVIPASITNIGIGAFSGNDYLTIYTERTSRPSTWNVNWNNSNRPVVWGCTLSSDKTYVNSFTKTALNPANAGASNGITNPYRKGYNFGGWYTTSDFSDTQYMDLTTAPNGILYAKWTKSCVAEGTLITLADGSQVAVEDLTGEELLLVWNLLTGEFDSAPILFIDSDPHTEYEIIHLYFSDGTEVKVIDEHGFWDFDLNQYVFLRNDAAQYIGHWFNKQVEDDNGNMTWMNVQLIDVDVYMEFTTSWSPVTFGHLCYYVNGMLSMPGATEGLINIFEVNPLTMQYDMAAMQRDIDEYGLFTYDEFFGIVPVPEIIFEAFNGQYMKVSIGKGLIDMEGLIALVERYADFFTEEDANIPDDQSDQDNGNHNGHNNGNGKHNGHGNGNHNGHRNCNHNGQRRRFQ